MKLGLAIIKSLVLAFCLVLAACSSEGLKDTNNSTIEDLNNTNNSATAQCADGIDNDSDGQIDLNDPGCADAADNNESDDPVSTGPDAARANSYDDAWESAWVAKAKTILSTPVSGITKTGGKVLQVGDSMTYSFAYGDWARHKTGATASDLDTINWMHAGAFDSTDGWSLSSDGTTAMNNAGWDSGFVDNIFVTADLNDAQFAVVMFNVNDMTFIKSRINEFIAAGIVPVLSTIPPRTDPVFDTTLGEPYNEALRALAEELSLPLIDYSKEILLRRPNGSWENTLISSDGVHPSGGFNGYSPISDPYADGGDALTHTTGDAALNSGYLLRTWLTVQKMKEIKQKAVD